MSQTARPINEIAKEIKQDWKKPYFGAVPYIAAMMTMQSAKDKYGLDNGTDIINRFLCNATTWRGEVARRVKKELNDAVKKAWK